MLRSELRLHTPLFVAQAAISNHTGLIARTGLAMPAAPFGTPAWQLPALLSYLHRLHQDEEDPSPDLWRAHTERQTGPVPRPRIRYRADGLHDPDAECVLDIQLGPRDQTTGWPTAHLAVIQQEEGACPFGRITRRHGIEAIAAYTAEELTAEHAALKDHARRHQDTAFMRLAELAQRAVHWADKIRAAAHTDAIRVQADRTRTVITR
ncbi:hypothetical protein RKD23_007950 [Streptomyces sp. SAI-170]|uniref:hypothetical protein n=1 Tax=Streptomyces sp. SAI-170 TaxID=3377729 RepID=UPI003C7C0CD4